MIESFLRAKFRSMMAQVNNAQFWLTRTCLQRGLAFIYCIGFAIALNQGPGLIGSAGILPAENFVPYVSFWDAPSLYHLGISDNLLLFGNSLGLILGLLALTGISERFGWKFSAAIWFGLWVLYLSLVNVGQIFYGYGWEIMLCEAGFLAIFLGSKDQTPPAIVIWMYRWFVFRMMFGAGMIKLRGDECWRDFTCMAYFYETQPLPNPLSSFFHHLPLWYHKLEVAITHFVEVIVPFGVFVPGRVCRITGILIILFQFSLILSGNLSWLNYITVIITLSCFDDGFLLRGQSHASSEVTRLRSRVLGALAILIGTLSLGPALNLVSSQQVMNSSFDPFNLVNTYGAFGSVTRTRYEIILEGTTEKVVGPATKWRPYEFRCKPGDLTRIPCVVSPYHYKLDWQMWFAAMSGPENHPWLAPFLYRLLQGESKVTGLLAHDPFANSRPEFIRARILRYEFAPKGESAQWRASEPQEYLRPISLRDFRRRE